MKNPTKQKTLMVSILSMSLLTVMAGAAVAPALGIIKAHFSAVNPLFVQMIISVPALTIIITNLIFPKLCRYFRSKTLVMAGLILYTAGGCAAGLFDNIGLVLAARALVGVGVGIIMPLSTGLLAFYFPPQEMERLMGYSSAMNQMGGAIATLLSGLLAAISWRAGFLVYLLGLFSFLLCLLFLPNDKLHSQDGGFSLKTLRGNSAFILAMFLLMLTFFLYPANFAIEIGAEGIVPQKFIAVIMAGMDLVAFLGGLLFVYLKIWLGKKTRFLAPLLFLLGYLLLTLVGGWVGAVAGSVCIGFANGMGIPYLIATASKKAGKAAATTIMPLLSAALYAAQFLTPMALGAVRAVVGSGTAHLPYLLAMALACLFFLCSAKIRES